MAKHARAAVGRRVLGRVFRHYKPDPETYLGAADLLGIAPPELMMVAAHTDDLRAAAEPAGCAPRSCAGRSSGGPEARCRRPTRAWTYTRGTSSTWRAG